MNASAYDNYFGASIEERAENMASSEWNLRERMPQRMVRGPPFRDLPETLEMTYIEEEGIVEANEEESEEEEDESESEEEEEEEESESEEEDESEEESESEEEEEEEEDEDEGNIGSNFYGDMLEDFEIYFDRNRFRFMEKFSEISERRNASSTIYCLSQHYELNYANYPNLYFLKLSASIEELKEGSNSVRVLSCSCPFFENGNFPCKHILLFEILYADFRGVRRSRRLIQARN